MCYKSLLKQKTAMCFLKQEKIGKGAKDAAFNLYYQENTMKGQKAQGPQFIRQTCKKSTNNIISLSVSSKIIV